MLQTPGTRLREHMEELGKIGAAPEGGVNRFTYSKEYYESVELVRRYMEDAGLETEVDPVGNVIGTCRGDTDRILLLGSHIDSVPNAGIFDGCLGVLAAVEAVKTLQEHDIQLQHTVKVAAWAEEEGNTVVGLLGSGAFVGHMDDLTDIAVSKMEQFGITRENVRAAYFPDLNKIDASLELHIEQGGILDQEQIQIGVVNGIVGIERYTVTIQGTKNHAGTTPMYLRDDAMTKAANLIVELEQLAREIDRDMVCTVGWLNASPGVANVIPGQIEMSVEVRSMNSDSMDRLKQYIQTRFPAGVCALKTTFQQVPVPMSDICKRAISKAAKNLGLSQRTLNSGAGHDTMILAERIPNCGMIFVPSVGGVSHCPQEWTEWEDANNGASVLLGALLELDDKDSTEFESR